MDTSISDRAEMEFTADAERWTAIATRDSAADDAFVYSVRSTGVYCRPSCPSRPARRENVAFHATCADAECAGFRPCRRCHPNQPGLDARHSAAVARACRQIDGAETMPSLDALAASAGLSRYHFHRLFKSMTGVTPKGYASQRRAARVAGELGAAETITRAVYDAGFNAASRFYEKSTARLGMTPSAYRAGGRGERIRFAIAKCSLGAILVAATGKGVCSITIGDDADSLVRDLRDRFPKATIVGDDPGFEILVSAVVGFVEEPRMGLNLPLDVRGTAFQQRVWQALLTIPAGETKSYADIAAAIGAPRAHRAVAAACAANKLAVAIPCHRVVRTDGALSGYRWGIDRKRALIAREAAQR